MIVVAAVVVACAAAASVAIAGHFASIGPFSGTADQHCTLTYLEHNVRVELDGSDADSLCSSFQRVDGSWEQMDQSAPAVEDEAIVCSGAGQGLTWTVYDTGMHFYGDQVCSGLNQWAHGGTLTVP